MDRIYLDYAATTPVAPQVREAMLPYFSDRFGNASSLHKFGLEAKAALDEARRTVANALHAEPVEIIFTSGGTEANNLAILGTAFRYSEPGHLITSSVEHPSVRQTCKFLQQLGWRITYLPVDRYGVVYPDELKRAITPETRLISIMYVNNETGALNPIGELASLARERGIPFHTDAVQAFGKLDIDVRSVPVSLLSLAGHKIYGPKGVGALYVRRGVSLRKLLHGGGQERDMRPGTENVAGIVGLAAAVQLCETRRQQDMKHLVHLSDYFMRRLKELIPGAVINGHPQHKVPWIINVSFPGLDNTSLVMGLDLEGIAVSNGSACSSGKVEPSHVLQAMGLHPALQKSAIRISLGRHTTQEELDCALMTLQKLTQDRIKRLQ